jgi:predicted transcriptional regulator
MSIRPQYADAILTGTKRVEFRKRRLAPDVSTVVIYATLPVGRIIGAFEVLGHDVAPPAELWKRHRAHAGISRTGYREYFANTAAAVGILVGGARRLPNPRLVTDVPGLSRPPQSFSYLSDAQAAHVGAWLQHPPRCADGDVASRSVLTSTLVRPTEAVRVTIDQLRQAV